MNERRPGRGPSPRMKELFAGITERKTYSEIHAGDDERSRRGVETNKRGLDSEIRAKRLIGKLVYVRAVSRSDPNSRLDRQGTDLTVHFWQDKGITLDSVTVQVKSSKARISEYKKRLMKLYELKSFDELNAFLREQHIIILNGSQSDEVILQNFERQLRDIQVTN